jgi:hypothetical protein
MGALETDYLVVGAGAAGMAFADSLVAHADADVVLVDRRHRPGGHWNDGYPFLRLHLPSALYGVASRPLGTETVVEHGRDAGSYERASAPEILDYFSRVLEEQLVPTGRVRFLGMADYAADGPTGHAVVSRLTGETTEVSVRRKLVDATYFEGQVPATHTPSFQIGAGVRLVPVGGLASVTAAPSRYVLVGGGKTAMDACLWLLDNGVEPDRIRWIRPRDGWFLDRAGWQPREQVASILEGLSLEVEALAQAASVDDLFRRLEQCRRLVRIDETVTPTFYRGATVSQAELAELRRVTDVVRLGHVRRIEPDRIVLEQGEVPTDPDALHVDCSAAGLARRPARPIFEPDRIVLQQVRSCSPTFNAALLGYVEATRDDVAEQNRLCPTNPYPDDALDWLPNMAVSLAAARAWQGEPDLVGWLEGCRLNILCGAFDHADEPRMQEAFVRYAANIKPGVARLRELMAAPAGSGIPAARSAAEAAAAARPGG